MSKSTAKSGLQMPRLKRFSIFIARATTVAGIIAIVNWLFNYPFTALIVWYLDPFLGGVLWFSLGILLNYVCVLWYKRTTSDWFGLEWLRLQETIEAESLTSRIIRRALKHSRFLVFILISVFLDPIYGFMYQRGRASGRHFNLGDYWWFVLANFLGMLPWFLGASVLAELLRYGQTII